MKIDDFKEFAISHDCSSVVGGTHSSRKVNDNHTELLDDDLDSETVHEDGYDDRQGDPYVCEITQGNVG